MAIHTPHFPDLLWDSAERLRRWGEGLVRMLHADGYREVHPSLVLREPLPPDTVRFFDGDVPVALRWDFTVSLARLLAQRFTEPPPRVCYFGAVFRRPQHPWEPVERFEVGCERLHTADEERPEVDAELATILLRVPAEVGLRGGLLQVGDADFVGRPMAIEGFSPATRQAVLTALAKRAYHRVEEAVHGETGSARFLAHVQALLRSVSAGIGVLQESPYADSLADEGARLEQTLRVASARLPHGFQLRVDLADVAGFGMYTGPTLRLWAPGVQQELASGGRYDGLYPELGRPWRAAGFCVRLTHLVQLAQSHPDLFEAQ